MCLLVCYILVSAQGYLGLSLIFMEEISDMRLQCKSEDFFRRCGRLLPKVLALYIPKFKNGAASHTNLWSFV